MRRESRLSALLFVLLIVKAGTGFAQETLRDPTRPYSAPVTVDVPPARFEVNAIINSDKRSLAIVNGRRVGIGDEIDGARVLAISKGEIVLEIDEQERTLTLKRGAPQR